MFDFVSKKISILKKIICTTPQAICNEFILKTRLKRCNRKAEENYTNNELINAENFTDKAYSIATKVYGKYHPEIIEALTNKAFFLFIRKDFEPSISYFKRAIDLNSKSLKDKSVLGEAYNGLGNIYKAKGDYQKSLDYFTFGVKLAQECNDNRVALHYCDLARVYIIQNNFEEAIDLYDISTQLVNKILENKTNKISNKYFNQLLYYYKNDLAEIHLSKGDIFKAKRYHAKAVKVLNNQSNFFEAYKRFEIPAKIYIKEKKYKEAVSQLKMAELAILKEYQGFEVGKDLANIIHQIGDCYIGLKEYDNALVTYQKALIAVCNTFSNEDIMQLPAIENIYNKRSAIASLSYKAATFLLIFETQNKTKALEEAYRTYQLIIKLIPVTRRDYVEENSKFQLADETKGIYEKAIKTCLNLHQLKKDETYLHQAFYFAESSKAIVLQENLQANFALEGVDESVQRQDISYRSKIAFYENSINTNKTIAGNEAKIEAWQKERYKCKEEYENFLKQIEQDYPTYYAVKYAHSIVNVAAIQKTLTTATALIEYFKGDKNTYVFVITKDTFKVQTIKTDQAILEKDIQQFKQLVYQPDRSGSETSYAAFKNLAYQLYKTLLHPSLNHLNQSIKNLIIIPDGLLYNIAFDALLTEANELNPAAFYSHKNLAYLFKQFALSYNYSASLLLKTISFTEESYQNVFAGFAPAFDNLNYNQEEVKQINDSLGGTVELGELANFEAFELKAKDSKILHLSTHAKQSADNHKLGEIQFADSTITNYHIENMQIRASLTVLSACETAAGLEQSGEGLMSLSRSFFLAGCPSLISSLWRADDESTADIMLYFYKHLKAGVSKAIALQQAKLQFCEEAGIRESHPFYWAGFVQSGNRKALF